MTTNCIKFENAEIATAKCVGSISTLTFEIEITLEPVANENPIPPTPCSRPFATRPLGRMLRHLEEAKP